MTANRNTAMNPGNLLAALIPIWMIASAGNCLGMQTASATEVLENSVFKKEVEIANGPSVYAEIVGLVHNPVIVDNPLPEAPSGRDMALAWKTVKLAEKDPKQFKTKIGSSVLALLHEVALSRNEILVEMDAGIAALPIQTPIHRTSYATFSQNNPQPSLGELRQLFLPKPIRLLGQDSMEIIRVFGNNLAETNQLRKNSPPIRASLTIEEPARETVKSLNIVGRWTYNGVLNVVCALGGLRWHIDGNQFVINAPKK
jgi:hypothetical protein